METTSRIYRESLSLATDLYQLTMSYGYWKTGSSEKEAVFHLFFRKPPFGGGYAVACGLRYAIGILKDFRFDDSDVAFLGTLTGNDGKPLFEKGYLDYLRQMEFCFDVDGVEEGTVVFANQPLLRIKGPIIQCQILETVLLCVMNFQTLIATKSARVCQAAKEDPVLEFGLRRAQGLDGALSASWAAYVGGCAATSNVLAGKLFGIPVKGTHAHSWIMSFDTEEEAFQSYAEAMPNNCVFLVDTYNTILGVKRAIEVGEWLRENGHEMVGIRLDSGDLAELSIEARNLLDDANFKDAVIVASNDLDERLVLDLKKKGCCISVWGIGTKLATAYDQAALGGVYKLAAIRKPGEEWRYTVKLSEQAIKVSNPGIQQVRRFYQADKAVADVIYDEELGIKDEPTLVLQHAPDQEMHLNEDYEYEDLLKPIFRNGKLVYDIPEAEETRGYVAEEKAFFSDKVKKFDEPDVYPVGLEHGLFDLKANLIARIRTGQK